MSISCELPLAMDAMGGGHSSRTTRAMSATSVLGHLQPPRSDMSESAHPRKAGRDTNQREALFFRDHRPIPAALCPRQSGDTSMRLEPLAVQTKRRAACRRSLTQAPAAPRSLLCLAQSRGPRCQLTKFAVSLRKLFSRQTLIIQQAIMEPAVGVSSWARRV